MKSSRTNDVVPQTLGPRTRVELESRPAVPPLWSDRRSRSTAFSRFARKAAPIQDLLITFCLVNIPFAIFFIWFVVDVLIRGHVQIGGLYIDASLANLLVSIFSQVTALLCGMNVSSLLRALRLALGKRPGGTRAATFFGLGAAAGWQLVLQLAVATGFQNLWCDFILVKPLIGLALGSVLKARTSFEYDFRPNNSTVRVFSGLIPLDLRVLEIVPIADQCQYYTSWTSSLLSSSKYSTETAMDDCNGDCRAFLLPGGWEATRVLGPSLNVSMYSNGTFQAAEAIQVSRAPGTILRFDPLESTFAFDLNADCVFGGKMMNDSFQMCFRQVNSSIAVGWAACPQNLFDANKCKSDLTWVSRTLKWSIKMSAYRQFTTTTYSRQNYSIIHSQPISTPISLFVNSTEYLTIARNILVPDDTASQTDGAAIYSLTYALTWLHRTFLGSFPDDTKSLTTTLYNFLAVPQQFMITAVQFANYTVESRGLEPLLGTFPLPDAMATIASAGRSSSRLAIFNPAGYAFIGGYVAVLGLVLVGIIWIVRQPSPLPDPTGIDELDIMISGHEARVTREIVKNSRAPQQSSTPHIGQPPTLVQLALAEYDARKMRWPTLRLVRLLRNARVELGKREEPHEPNIQTVAK